LTGQINEMLTTSRDAMNRSTFCFIARRLTPDLSHGWRRPLALDGFLSRPFFLRVTAAAAFFNWQKC
jgi:hypothetical protein